MNINISIGFIGQGWIGKNYADDFEKRGYKVTRFSLDDEYINNKEKISFCDIVFIAVPTPTNLKGFDDSFLHEVLPLVGKGKIAVIKSTISLGKTNELQNKYKKIYILHSPEFLSERTAAHDAQFPDRNIIGIPKNTSEYKAIAEKVMSILPKSPYNIICYTKEAEFIKYAHNVNGYIQVVFSNILFDLAKNSKMDWDVLRSAFLADPFMSHKYLNPLDRKGRGAGGNCFIKDFEAFIQIAINNGGSKRHIKVLKSVRDLNIELLLKSKKSVDLVNQVYSKKFLLKIIQNYKNL